MTRNILKYRVQTTSSLVHFLEYDQGKMELLVKYKRGKHKGRLRKYLNVNGHEVRKVLESDSVGTSLIKLVRNKEGRYIRFNFLAKMLAF